MSDVKDILGLKRPATGGDAAPGPAGVGAAAGAAAGAAGAAAAGGKAGERRRESAGAVATSIMPSFPLGMKETRRKEARNTFWEWRGFTVRARDHGPCTRTRKKHPRAT